ncbi:GNAT family N-acetyltransferase [Massilia sp. TS11]|uniref:GNAT family N-acetyltransferase n=1 Tax=Massilia sp. TS11 TaxID=2908003 RepID=UPI001EDBDC80|nr:GNAT family N-acetyltransferase [Massilia sp. TS11]MCG2583714.1 GNAT family N-acetyltransferase [Massilia sp. TS11]
MNIIETARLRLRTINLDDAPFYHELVNDPAWIRHIGDRNIHTLEAAREAIATGPMAAHTKLGFSLYVCERKEDGAPLGLCGLIKRDTLPDVDIGYAFLAAHRGHGYAREAAEAVLAYARDILRLPRLAAITGPDNTISNAMLRSLGFQFVGTTRLTPELAPTNLYQLTLS